MTEEKRRYVYKKVKIAMPHCTVCGEQLSGNNSMILPYKCSCGTWESDFRNPFVFTIKKDDKPNTGETTEQMQTCEKEGC